MIDLSTNKSSKLAIVSKSFFVVLSKRCHSKNPLLLSVKLLFLRQLHVYRFCNNRKCREFDVPEYMKRASVDCGDRYQRNRVCFKFLLYIQFCMKWIQSQVEILCILWFFQDVLLKACEEVLWWEKKKYESK